jgi:hypothetical protein
MKKIFLTMAVVMAVGFTNAQKKSGSNEIEFGVKGGLNFSNLSGDGSPTMKVGVQLGIFGEYKIDEKFSIQPELLYSTQGAKYEFSDYDGVTYYTENYDYKLSYLNIPIMAKYYVSEKFSFEAGPQFGFLLNANEDYSYVESDEFGVIFSESGSQDVKKYLNSVDYGINLGIGYNVNDKISLVLRYNLGLNDLEKDLASGRSGHKNKVLQLSFGYKF